MTYKLFNLIIITTLVSISTTSYAEVISKESDRKELSTSSDPRVLVSIPDESLQLMRKDMIDLLSALGEILQSLSSGNLDLAAEIAENRMGKSAMGKHRQTGMGPGRFMPIPMRNIAWGLHEAASEFAVVAAKGDLKQAYISLNNVISHCAACHNTYRTK